MEAQEYQGKKVKYLRMFFLKSKELLYVFEKQSYKHTHWNSCIGWLTGLVAETSRVIDLELGAGT